MGGRWESIVALVTAPEEPGGRQKELLQGDDEGQTKARQAFCLETEAQTDHGTVAEVFGPDLIAAGLGQLHIGTVKEAIR